MAERADQEAYVRQFIEFFYGNYDNAETRPNVINCYRPTAVYTSPSGDNFTGVEEINSALEGLSFQRVQREISTIDIQETGVGLLVHVGGVVQVDDEKHSVPFTHIFHLIPEGEEVSVIQNEIHRIAW